MQTEYILNELSLNNLGLSSANALAAMDLFVDVLKESRSMGITPNVRTHVDLKEIELHPGYFISNWCVDQAVSRDKRIYIAKLLTSFPLLKGLPAQLIEDNAEVEVLYENVRGDGLTVAFLTENPVLSFNSDPKWAVDELDVKVNRLKVDISTGAVSIIEEFSKVINFATSTNLASNKPKVEALQLRRFSTVESFWEKKEKLFDKLEFSPDVYRNLIDVGIKEPLFPQIIGLLKKLNDYCISWTSGPCVVANHIPNISGESTSTMQQFGESRKFKNSSGTHYTCELHARLTPGAQRLHFFPLESEKKIFIGYIGVKLTSTNYRT